MRKTERIGFDLGNTIFTTLEGKKYLHHGALRVIKRLVARFGAENCFIVSKVTPEQKIRALACLEREGFHEITGLPIDHVEFCAERHEKAPICERLGITHFVDDRPEVLSHLKTVPHRFLFQGIAADYELFTDKLQDVILAESWEDVEKFFL